MMEFDAPRWGEQLGARHLVRGSVQRVGDRLLIRSELIDATTGTQRWSEQCDRLLVDMFALQDEIAEQVASAIGRRLFDPLPHHRERMDPEAFDAYDALLRGGYLQRQQTKESAEQARHCYEEALAYDPELVHAHYGMATSYAFDLMNLTAEHPAEAGAKLFEHARKVARYHARLDERAVERRVSDDSPLFALLVQSICGPGPFASGFLGDEQAWAR